MKPFHKLKTSKDGIKKKITMLNVYDYNNVRRNKIFVFEIERPTMFYNKDVSLLSGLDCYRASSLLEFDEVDNCNK